MGVKKTQLRRNSTLTRKLSDTLPACPEQIEGRRLTRREREIVAALLRGAANKDIARELGTSHQTVKSQLSTLFKRMGVSGRLELAGR